MLFVTITEAQPPERNTEGSNTVEIIKLSMDATNKAYWTILSQNFEWQKLPIAYASKLFTKEER